MSECPGCNAVGCRPRPTPNQEGLAMVQRHQLVGQPTNRADLGSQVSEVHVPHSIAESLRAANVADLTWEYNHGINPHLRQCKCQVCDTAYPDDCEPGAAALAVIAARQPDEPFCAYCGEVQDTHDASNCPRQRKEV